MSEQLVICGYARTPMGGMMGSLSTVPAPELGSTAVAAAMQRAGVEADAIDEVLMGCVLPAGLGQSPARQAALGAGLPVGVGTTTVNKMCGSGMKTVMMACDTLAAGQSDIVAAGGMESMSN
ncbi:MAG TPA: acetyl-CoA C-acetyltransferase, partial [Porticoccaceae bacterium]|nr:acetyl-CoA C-acetyltransferase [Porticoccaceae bacterium]HCO60892.1 acetyl-CoA C-acetyltransferase [Porticoccaceae bacterium]